MADEDRIRWDERYRGSGPAIGPDPFLVVIADRLPDRGRALDVAGGLGGNATWLAARGLAVTLADISGVALEHAARASKSAGVEIATRQVDLEAASCPAGPWDVIACVRFLHRPLLAGLAAVAAPGGLLVVVHPTARNLERHERPGRRFLLDEGELPGLLDGWDILHHEEAWAGGPGGRHEARCLARRGDRDG